MMSKKKAKMIHLISLNKCRNLKLLKEGHEVVCEPENVFNFLCWNSSIVNMNIISCQVLLSTWLLWLCQDTQRKRRPCGERCVALSLDKWVNVVHWKIRELRQWQRRGQGKRHLKIITCLLVTICDCPVLFTFYNVGRVRHKLD